MRTARQWLTITLTAVTLLSPVTGWSAQERGPVDSLSGYDPKRLVFVVNRDSSDIAVIDSTTDAVITKIALGTFSNGHMAMLTNDGKRLLVSATGKDRFLIVDLRTLAVGQSIATGRSPEHFDVSADDRFAYVGNMEDSTVSVIDLQEGKEATRLAGFFEPHGFSVMPDGSKVYVSNVGAHEVGLIQRPAHQLAKRLAVGGAHRFAARDPDRYLGAIKGIANPTLTPDGRFAYAADGDAGEVGVIDTRTDRLVTTIKVGEEPWRAYASPDGRWVLVPNNGDESISVISTATHKVVTTLKGGREMTGINFVQGGKKAYVISRGNSTVYVYDMQTFHLVNRLKIGTNLALETASTTADGARVYLASSTDDSVYVIDGTTDQVKRIANVGRYPWGVTILGAASSNYCH